MSREYSDAAAAKWKIACNVIGPLTPQITVPTTALSIILLGYDELRTQREAALDAIGSLNDRGVHPLVIADLRHALGEIFREDLAEIYQQHGAVLPEGDGS